MARQRFKKSDVLDALEDHFVVIEETPMKHDRHLKTVAVSIASKFYKFEFEASYDDGHDLGKLRSEGEIELEEIKQEERLVKVWVPA